MNALRAFEAAARNLSSTAGLGVALGPSSLVAADLRVGRLAAPFPGLALPARPYYWYCSIETASDDAVIAFREWLMGAATVS